jgi:segregation and condensation protein B
MDQTKMPTEEGKSAYDGSRSDSLGLDGLIEPNDDGISLDELSQAYVALLSKGSDPYSNESEPTTEERLPPEIVEVIDDPVIERERQPPDGDVTPRGILEAMLFVGHPTGEPLTSERIASFMRGVRPAEIDELVRELNAEYDEVGAPYLIVSDGPGYRMELRPDFAGLREAFYGKIREARLSQAAIDVLAIVGYHQPVGLEEIDRLRGKSSGAIVAQLVRRDLLLCSRVGAGRAKVQYTTTRRFLSLFGLEDISQLPRSRDFER